MALVQGDKGIDRVDRGSEPERRDAMSESHSSFERAVLKVGEAAAAELWRSRREDVTGGCCRLPQRRSSKQRLCGARLCVSSWCRVDRSSSVRPTRCQRSWRLPSPGRVCDRTHSCAMIPVVFLALVDEAGCAARARCLCATQRLPAAVHRLYAPPTVRPLHPAVASIQHKASDARVGPLVCDVTAVLLPPCVPDHAADVVFQRSVLWSGASLHAGDSRSFC